MDKLQELEAISRSVRLHTLDMIYRTRGPHIGSSFSCIDLLTALYFHTLRISPRDPANPQRDRFIFSKGHAAPGLYAVLHSRGFISQKDMDGFATNGGTLQQHPDLDPLRGIEVSTGSLGHGLSVGAGMAYALKKDGNPARVFVMMSDGELNEGSTWEAVLFAAQHNLENLVLLIDYNRMQALGFTRDTLELDPMADKFAAFNWAVETIDGHCFREILRSCDGLPFQAGKPSLIIAETIKGRGVSFMQNKLYWHYCCPNQEEYTDACQELKL